MRMLSCFSQVIRKRDFLWGASDLPLIRWPSQIHPQKALASFGGIEDRVEEPG